MTSNTKQKMSSRDSFLKKIDELSFATLDLTLYLDTHPDDQEALAAFLDYQKQRKQALEEFQTEHYALTVDCISTSATKWTWGDAPPPWEGDSNVEL